MATKQYDKLIESIITTDSGNAYHPDSYNELTPSDGVISEPLALSGFAEIALVVRNATSATIQRARITGRDNAEQIRVVQDSDASGLFALRLDSGDIVVHSSKVAYDPDEVYKVTIRAKEVSTGVLLCGVVGYQADDVPLNSAGDPLLSDYLQVVLTSSESVGGDYANYTGYVSGLSGSGFSEPADSPDSPSPVYTGTAKIGVVLEASSGQFNIDQITLEPVSSITDQPGGTNALSAYTSLQKSFNASQTFQQFLDNIATASFVQNLVSDNLFANTLGAEEAFINRLFLQYLLLNRSSVRSNTCGAGSTTTAIVLDASASATDDEYNGYILIIDGEYRVITDYVGATKTATVSAFTSAPSSGDGYEVASVGSIRSDYYNNDGTVNGSSTHEGGAFLDADGRFMLGDINSNRYVRYDPTTGVLDGNVAYDQWDLVIESDADLALLEDRTAWVTATVYSAGDKRKNDDVAYVCILGHTSSATDEPGTGATWEAYWEAIEYSYVLVTSGTYNNANTLNLEIYSVKKLHGISKSESIISMTKAVTASNHYVLIGSMFTSLINISFTFANMAEQSFLIKIDNTAISEFIDVKITSESQYGYAIVQSPSYASNNVKANRVDIHNAYVGMYRMNNISACYFYNCNFGIYDSSILDGCIADGCGRSFYSCDQLVNCRSFNSTGVAGFYNCEFVSNCKDYSSDGYAFSSCKHVTTSYAYDAGSSGFYLSKYLTSCFADRNGTYGFESCDYVVNNRANLNTTAATLSVTNASNNDF